LPCLGIYAQAIMSQDTAYWGWPIHDRFQSISFAQRFGLRKPIYSNLVLRKIGTQIQAMTVFESTLKSENPGRTSNRVFKT